MAQHAIPTRRPSPSSSGEEPRDPIGEIAEQLGKVMGAQEELRLSVTRQIGALRSEHETYTRTVVALHRDVKELLDKQERTGRIINRSAKVMPGILGVIELVRYLIENFANN